MSQSKYYGKAFKTKQIFNALPGVCDLVIGDRQGEEDFIPNPGSEFGEALTGLADTLRVTRKLLKLYVRMKGVQITAENEFNREMDSVAKKIGESSDDVRVTLSKVCSELFAEMLEKQQSKKKS